jgi:hypothetical protein
MTAEKAVGKRTRASIKADTVAPKGKKWWGHFIYVEDRLRQVFTSSLSPEWVFYKI